VSRPSKARAHALGRPKGSARIVEVFGEAYEVLPIRGGGEKIFRLELELVPGESHEANIVRSQMRYDDFEERRRLGRVKPGEPRPVRPHRSGGGVRV
jgi:hypothetical protein